LSDGAPRRPKPKIATFKGASVLAKNQKRFLSLDLPIPNFLAVDPPRLRATPLRMQLPCGTFEIVNAQRLVRHAKKDHQKRESGRALENDSEII
jgi:hypothetical protein